MDEAVSRAPRRTSVTARTDARGWPTTVTVDALTRVTGKLYMDGTRDTFTFDAAGRQTTMQDVTGITTYTLDAVGQRTNVLDFMGTPITYQFDPAGNRTYMKDPPGHYWTYTWDPDGRLAAVWNSYSQFTTLAHDPLGRETQRVLANGVNIQRTFDPAGREIVLSELKPDGSALQVYTASYDPVGNRLGVQEYDGTRVTYTHDPSYQLTREQRGGAHAFDVTLGYDGAGNRISKADATGTTNYQHDAANELVLTTPPTGAPTTSTWDANGNLAVEITGAQRTTYAWDGENRLTHIDLPSGATESNTYRADGLRRSHTTMDGTTLFVLDEQNVLLETGDTGAIYTQLPGIWGGAFSVKRGSATEYLVPDLQGHTRYRTTAAAAVNDEIVYDAWGREVWAWGTHTNMLKAFGQFGYWRDTAERLYVRARHLRVDQGRWSSRDPIGFDGGDWNLYGYVGAHPDGVADPGGRQWAGPGHGASGGKPGHLAISPGDCRRLSPGACFACYYRLLSKRHVCPQRACDVAKSACGSHTVCGVCGPGPDPSAPDDCVSLLGGRTGDAGFAAFLRGIGNQQACGGYGGADKLAHCWANCMIVRCAQSLECLVSTQDTPADDVIANERGRACGWQPEMPWTPPGSSCLECCSKAVYWMECW